MALSKKEATSFLRDVIRVPDSVFSGKQPSLSFLNCVIKTYLNAIPWQSVTSCAVPRGERHLPTWEEIKRRQFAKQGGRYYENNMFMKELLTAFNFDVCYISCHIWDPNDHMTVMVRGLTETSSRHWVDVGSAFPLFQSIPFDFEGIAEYDLGFVRQRFVKENGIIEWHHSRHYPPFPGSKLTRDGEWYIFAKIKADEPCDPDTFKPRMSIRYTEQEESIYLQEATAEVYKENKLIAIKGMKLVMERNDKTIERKQMSTIDEVVEAYKKYFPQIPTDIVQEALKNTITNHSH